MLTYDLKSVRRQFFDVKAIRAGMAPESQKILSEFGRDVRQTDRKSIKPRKQKTLSEMSPEELERHRLNQRIAKQEGLPAPKKPTKGSEPGEAPRRGKKDLLRKYTFYIYDASTDSVVVGAARLGGVAGRDAPEKIEGGGDVEITYGPNREKKIRMAPRPHLGPAYRKHLPKLPGRFRGRFS